jgi:ribonuclease PH
VGEVQGTAEGAPYSRAELETMLGLAEHGITQLIGLQREMVSEPPAPR